MRTDLQNFKKRKVPSKFQLNTNGSTQVGSPKHIFEVRLSEEVYITFIKGKLPLFIL